MAEEEKIDLGVRDRFIQFLESLPLNYNQFAKAIGLSSGHISAITVRGSKPGTEFWERVLMAYPTLNMNWLFKGKGEMYTDGGGESEKMVTVTVNPEGDEIAAFVPIKAQAGYLSGYGDPEFIQQLPGVVTPFFKAPDIRIFEVKGDSMEPTFYERDVVFAQRVYDLNEIRNGRVYVVVSRTEGIVLKRVQKHRNEPHLVLYSDNKFYEPYEINLEDVLELWYFRRKFSAQAPPPSTLEERIYELERFMFDLQKRLGRSGRTNVDL